MQFTTYDDVHLHGQIGPFEFLLVSDHPEQVRLEVGDDGAWTGSQHRTVGEALRELARLIGEG